MPSHKSEHVLQSYQDFLQYCRRPELLHRDLALEQKTHEITQLNQDLKVGGSWLEAGHPNQNPVE